MTAKLLVLCVGGFAIAWLGQSFGYNAVMWCGFSVAILSAVLIPTPWFGYQGFFLYNWVEDWLGGEGGGDGSGGDSGGDGGVGGGGD